MYILIKGGGAEPPLALQSLLTLRMTSKHNIFFKTWIRIEWKCDSPLLRITWTLKTTFHSKSSDPQNKGEDTHILLFSDLSGKWRRHFWRKTAVVPILKRKMKTTFRAKDILSGEKTLLSCIFIRSCLHLPFYFVSTVYLWEVVFVYHFILWNTVYLWEPYFWGSTSIFEKSTSCTSLFWEALYIYEKLSSVTIFFSAALYIWKVDFIYQFIPKIWCFAHHDF